MAIRLGFAGLCLVLVLAGPGALAQSAHDELIARHAAAHGVPETLVRRVIAIESRGNAGAVSKGNYGLMQIRLGTARAMGYGGEPNGLLDADTNLKYAVKYLAGAYRAAGCNVERAIALYQRGYHGVRSTCATAPVQTGRGFMLAQAQTKSVDSQPAAADAIKPKVVHTVAVPSSARPSVGAGTDATSAPQTAPAKVLSADKPEPIKAQAGGKPADAQPAPAVASAHEADTMPRSTRKSDALVPRAAIKPVESSQPVLAAAPVVAEQPKPVAQPKPAEQPFVAAATTGYAPNLERDVAAKPEADAKPAAAKKERKRVREAAVAATPREPVRTREATPKQEDDIPTKVVSFFKKLVTPEQKTEAKPARRPREQHLQAVR